MVTQRTATLFLFNPDVVQMLATLRHKILQSTNFRLLSADRRGLFLPYSVSIVSSLLLTKYASSIGDILNMMNLRWIYSFAACLQWIIYPFCQLSEYIVICVCLSIQLLVELDTKTNKYICYEDVEIIQVQNNQKVE